MKRSLADRIEQYIKVLIERSGNNQIEIQRSELSETFNCVPSQVSYVLGTRFTEKEGYYIESRRGGKGFVRITHFIKAEEQDIDIKELIHNIEKLLVEELLTEKEAELIKHIAVYILKDQDQETKNKLTRNLIEGIEGYCKHNFKKQK
ncbi:Transcriptional regulator CtsR [Candidatus Syntrophocurvum alkaliphilum]|uniref:Transcriptional regulator CtsR n=1 Tax=Candidatus Syntrophocurvum alkaliphilum TaxID=2293317 RepID=A0A6I6DI53_9FIRM|nr:CtsR family transcriptional regulator [Candidatus Syntrophocurvum alkaliphilum]QGU00743.1 Transcriptional regulator CtsR [Candidatus Syntrophocurvum alkaliphilum]